LIGTFGAPVELTPAGVALDAGGVPLYGETADVTTLYRIYEDAKNFSYVVWVNVSNAIDANALERALNRLTPAGITFVIDNSKTNVLSYMRAVRDDQPNLHLRLGSSAEASGYGHVPTAFGGLTFGNLASPGLLVSTTNDMDGAVDLDGTDDYVQVASHSSLLLGNFFSLEAWIRLDATPGTQYTIMTKGPNSWQLYIDSARHLYLAKHGVGTIAQSDIALTQGTTYYIVATKHGTTSKIYIDAVDHTTPIADLTLTDTGINLNVGQSSLGTQFFNGVIDEAAVYNYALSLAQIEKHYKAGKNLLT
jgi:Concanavalin A-like lectin/glucanases superfamily